MAVSNACRYLDARGPALTGSAALFNAFIMIVVSEIGMPYGPW